MAQEHDQKRQLVLLVDAFITEIKKESYANKFYDWTQAERFISLQLYDTYLNLSQFKILQELNDYSYNRWESISDYCVGFNVGKVANEDGVLSDRLYAHTNVYEFRFKHEEIVTEMYRLKYKCSPPEV